MTTEANHGTCENCEHEYARSQWPDGPWSNEPDRVEFEHAGFNCLLHRGPTGVWCGYVGVRPGHPCFGKSCNDLDFDVHGGLTYSDKCAGAICHIPKPGEPDELWWFGFDCAHGGDLSPQSALFHQELAKRPGSSLSGGAFDDYFTYRDIEYARKQTESLAEQLRNEK